MIKFVEFIQQKDHEQERKHILKQLFKIIGFDLGMASNQILNQLVDIDIVKIRTYTYNSLIQVGQSLQDVISRQLTYPEYHDANLTLFAISRARIQYLGQNIPIFKLKHSLFEALMSSLHPEEVTPLTDSNLNICREDRQKQENFMIRKLIEFYSNDHLRILVDLSFKGRTIEFIEAFNHLDENQSPWYSKYKISLYDINIRRFVSLQPAEGMEIYLVHYNGFVFGTNYAKLMVIRERESSVNHKKGKISIFDEDEDFELNIAVSQSENNLQSQQDENKIEIASPEKWAKEHSVYDLPQEFTEQIEIYKHQQKEDDEMSDVEVKQAFIMNSNMLKSNTRRAKIESLSQKNVDKTCRCGLLAYKIEFQKQDINGIEKQKIKRLACYGVPGYGDNLVRKTFEGKNAHVLFLLWILQYSIDYFKDARKQSRFLNLFSMNGQSKEMSLILRGLVQIMGRDAHFIGDPNKLKLIWVENIRFYDIGNYFEDIALKDLSTRWQITQDLNYKDQLLLKVQCIYQIARNFMLNLRKLKFADQIYDFTVHGQGSGNSLGLSIFQYFYLDKQHIKGTPELEILEKEKLSMKSPYFYINQLNQSNSNRDFHEIDLESNIYRLYESEYSIAQCFMNFPVPIEYSKQRNLNIEINFESDQYKLDYKKQHSIYVIQNNIRFKLLYSSLYFVQKLVKVDKTYNLPTQKPDGLVMTTTLIENEYIWGVELIEAIAFQNSNSIRYLHITEEIMYLQSRIFQPFIRDVIANKSKTENNQIQQDILNMILNGFHHRFTQKYVGMHLIIHINDLALLRQTCITNESQITKFYEISHPYYFIEYFPDGSDPLQQVGSLYRLTAYINACNRVFLSQQMCKISPKNILYMDQQHLLLKNQWLNQQQQNQNTSLVDQQLQSFGKYKLIVQTLIVKDQDDLKSQEQNEITQMPKFDLESQKAEQQIITQQFLDFVKYFQHKINLPYDFKEFQKQSNLQKLYNHLFSLPKELDDTSDHQKSQIFLEQINQILLNKSSEFALSSQTKIFVNSVADDFEDFQKNYIIQSSHELNHAQFDQQKQNLQRQNFSLHEDFQRIKTIDQINSLKEVIKDKLSLFEHQCARGDKFQLKLEKRYEMESDDSSLERYSQNKKLKRKCLTQLQKDQELSSSQALLMLSQNDINDIMKSEGEDDIQDYEDSDFIQDKKLKNKSIQNEGKLVKAFFTQL
eukprot:403373619